MRQRIEGTGGLLIKKVIDQTMSVFDQQEFQAETFARLRHIIQTRQIPNALLFHGNKSTRRKEAAFLFAKLLNCNDNTPSDECQCRSCKKIDAQSHPDILEIKLSGNKKAISIAQIREAGLAISAKPNEALYRMVLIHDADMMNIQAQNALLKILEEPPVNTFFILITDKVGILLPTIISRCREIRFSSLSEKDIENYLIHTCAQAEEQAKIAARTAAPDLAKARELLNLNNDDLDINWIERRKWLFENITLLIKQKSKALPDCFILSQRLSLDPDMIGNTITIMSSFFRDLVVYKFNPEKIINVDFSNTLSEINKAFSSTIFFHWLEELHKTEKKIQANGSLRLTMESFFLKLIHSTRKSLYD